MTGSPSLFRLTCPTCGWIVTDEFVDHIATLTERTTHLAVSVVFVRCPECNVPILQPINVDEARHRIRHAHDDLGDGGLCTQCGRLHAATVVPCCERCGEPDTTATAGHHHCPEWAVLDFTAGVAS